MLRPQAAWPRFEAAVGNAAATFGDLHGALRGDAAIRPTLGSRVQR